VIAEADQLVPVSAHILNRSPAQGREGGACLCESSRRRAFFGDWEASLNSFHRKGAARQSFVFRDAHLAEETRTIACTRCHSRTSKVALKHRPHPAGRWIDLHDRIYFKPFRGTDARRKYAEAAPVSERARIAGSRQGVLPVNRSYEL
jgi:hypothetical protein